MDDLVARVGRLEVAVTGLQGTLEAQFHALNDRLDRQAADLGETKGRVADIGSQGGKVAERLDRMAVDLGELKGRSAAMPTMWQLLLMVLAIMGLMVGIATFTANRLDRIDAKVERLVSHHPAAPSPTP